MSKDEVLGMIKHHIKNFPVSIKQLFCDKKLPETVYFYTLHKCASTLFSSYILKNIEGLQHVDYAGQIHNGSIATNEKLIFRKRGYVYGPIRLSTDRIDPDYEMLIIPTSEHKFILDKIAIFFVRDPRDILVSAYYSLAYSHIFSPVKEIRERQEVTRNTIQTISIDEYVLECAQGQAKNFAALNQLADACERSIILKYEDMVNNFEYFIDQLSKSIVMDKDVVQEIYRRSRPKQKEEISSHRRSGRVGDFRNKLNEKTIESLNTTLEETLAKFKYEL